MPDIFIQPEEKHTNHAAHSVHALMQQKPLPLQLLSAYCTRPEGVTFANQEPDEAILLFLRRHFITNLPWIIFTLFLFIIPPLLVLINSVSEIFPFAIPTGLLIVIVIFYYLLILGYAFGNFISWFYNIGIVTQKHVIDLDSSNILSHNTTTAGLNEVVDVKFTQRGFFQSSFNYGDIHVQTEALRANFDFIAAPNPTQVEDIISDLRSTKGGTDANT